MDAISTNTALTMDSIIAILGIVATVAIAVIGGIYKIVTNTKKYELTENYRRELIQWYTSVVNLMIKIIHHSKSGEFHAPEFSSKKTEMLSQLSALTEVGRFYFPNVIKGDGFGTSKPTAYQGYRHINLEFLLHFYYAASNNSGDENIRLLWRLERNFTAVIFDMVEPRKRNHDYSKYLALTFPPDRAIEDFIYENPKNLEVFGIR